MWNICKPAKQSQPTFGAAPCLWLISSSDSQQHPASTRQLVRQCFPSDQRLPEGLHLCDWGKQEWLDRDSNINKIRYFVFWWTVLTRHEYTADREAHSHLQMGVFLQLSKLQKNCNFETCVMCSQYCVTDARHYVCSLICEKKRLIRYVKKCLQYVSLTNFASVFKTHRVSFCFLSINFVHV